MKAKLFPNKLKYSSGFSMIEFIIVIVIFSIMAGVTIFDYNKYRDTIEQNNVAQDISLSIRQAQVYGLSGSDRDIADENFDADYVLGQTITSITQDRSSRGVAFFPAQSRIVIFEDLVRDGVFNPSQDRIIDERSIINDNITFELCLTNVDINDWGDCMNITSEISNSSIAVSFQRPYPDATIKDLNGTSYNYLIIRVQGLRAERDRYIKISPIGRISIHKTL